MARIAVGGFQHETNSFAPSPATFEDFARPGAWPGLTRGPALFEAVAGINIPIAGFIEEARALDRLPALLLIAIVAPGVLAAGWLGAAAAAVTAAIAVASGNPFVAMGGGVAVVAIGRQVLAGL